MRAQRIIPVTWITPKRPTQLAPAPLVQDLLKAGEITGVYAPPKTKEGDPIVPVYIMTAAAKKVLKKYGIPLEVVTLSDTSWVGGTPAVLSINTVVKRLQSVYA